MPKESAPDKRPGSKGWLITTIVCGLILVTSILIGLGSSVARRARTIDIMVQPGVSSEDLSQLHKDSADLTRRSLYFGTPIAFLYLTALFMYRRSKKALPPEEESTQSQP